MKAFLVRPNPVLDEDIHYLLSNMENQNLLTFTSHECQKALIDFTLSNAR